MASFLKKGAPTSRIPLFWAVFDIYETFSSTTFSIRLTFSLTSLQSFGLFTIFF